jgi:hypothetical protein
MVESGEVFRRNLIVRFLVTGALFLLPFSVLLWVSDQIFWETRAETEKASIDRLNQIVAHAVRLADPLSFFQQSANRIKRALIWGDDPVPLLKALPAGQVKCFLFNARGKRKMHPGFADGFVFVSERCLAGIFSSARNKSWRPSDKEKKLAETFFGGAGAIGLAARNPGKLQNLETLGIPRTVGVLPFRDRKGQRGFLLVIIDNENVDSFGLAGNALRKIAKLAGPGFGFGLLDLDNQHPDELAGMKGLPEGVRREMCSFSRPSLFRKYGGIWSLGEPDRRLLLFGTCNELPVPASFPERQRGFLGRGLGILALLLLLQVFQGLRGIPIRVQVGLSFTLAAIWSTITLLGFAGTYLETRQKTLLRERFEETGEILNKIDTSFSLYKYRLQHKYRRLGREIAPFLSGPPPSGDFRNAWGLPESVSILVFDTKGKLWWQRASTRYADSFNVFGKDFLESVSRIVKLAVMRYEVQNREGPPPDDHPIFKGQSAVVCRSSDQWQQKQGVLSELAFGQNRNSFFFNFLFDPTGKIVGTIFILHEENLLERSYLRYAGKLLREYSFLNTYAFRFFPLKQVGHQGPRSHPFLAWPALQNFHALVNQVKNTAFAQGQWGGHSLILSGIPGKSLQGFNLLLVSSQANLDREARRLTRVFFGFALLVVMFALSLSVVFANVLLDPILQLSVGLENLSQSVFSTPVDLKTGDEFQLIGEGINNVFEEMQELSIARDIQEQLFPAGPLQSGQWSCQGWNRSSSEIGGDLFDFLELPDRRLLLWMARIPGHSIGSALFLAMTKMVIWTLVDLKISDPGLLFENLRQTMDETKERVGENSLLIAVLDQETGKVSLTGTGCFGIGKSSPGEEGEALVLGAAFSLSFNLAAGGRLFILSEGCCDTGKDVHAQRESVNRFLAAVARLPSPIHEADLFESLAGQGQVSRSRETQTVLVLEGKPG